MEKSQCSWGLNELSDDLIAITEKEEDEAALKKMTLLPVLPEVIPEVVAPGGIAIMKKKATPNIRTKNNVLDQSVIDKINSVNRDISKKVEADTSKEIRRVNPELPCINPQTLMYQSHVLPNVANSMNKDQ